MEATTWGAACLAVIPDGWLRAEVENRAAAAAAVHGRCDDLSSRGDQGSGGEGCGGSQATRISGSVGAAEGGGSLGSEGGAFRIATPTTTSKVNLCNTGKCEMFD